ncbi:MAG: CHASE3 domain-containing protein [Acidobacteriaceae bacterium]|nr:CHASE3 domain-containing protein [Acidobacteriaceae bacterium]
MTTSQRVFRRQIRSLVIVPLIMLSAIVALLAFQVHRLTTAQAWVDHTDVVLGQARLLLRFIIDQETGLRGYLLTDDQHFLQPYHQAEQALPGLFQQLNANTADNSAQQQQLSVIQRSYDQWHTYAQDAIARAHQGDTEVNSVAFTLAGKQMMDSLRQQQQSFVDHEDQLKVLRAQHSQVAEQAVNSTLLGLFVIFAFVLLTQTRRSIRSVDSEYAAILDNLQKRSAELSASRERLHVTLRSIGDGVIVTDAQGKITFLNPVAEKLTGSSLDRANGQPLGRVFNIINEETRKPAESPFDKVMRLGTVVGLANHTALVRDDGSEISIDDSGAPIRGEDGQIHGVVLVFRDVTEQNEMLKVLQMNEKLAAAGKLSASIAHEIHNPLETVGNLLFLIRKQSNSDMQKLVTMADQELSRVVQITKNILSLYRESRKLIPLKLSEVLESVSLILQRPIRDKQIALSTRVLTQAPISAFPAEMRQVVSNLMTNAIDAVPTGGQIEVSIEEVPLKDSQPGVMLMVRDNGHGISHEHRAKVFQPFFTTKGENGTGLGLWITHGIVSKIGGYIEIASDTSPENHGTTFKLFFPRLATEARAAD